LILTLLAVLSYSE